MKLDEHQRKEDKREKRGDIREKHHGDHSSKSQRYQNTGPRIVVVEFELIFVRVTLRQDPLRISYGRPV